MVVPAVATLFVNVGSVRMFEPDRSALLRIAVTVLVGLTIAGPLSRATLGDASGVSTLKRSALWLRRRPLVVAALSYGLAISVSTALAIEPRRSLLGSYERGY